MSLMTEEERMKLKKHKEIRKRNKEILKDEKASPLSKIFSYFMVEFDNYVNDEKEKRVENGIRIKREIE